MIEVELAETAPGVLLIRLGGPDRHRASARSIARALQRANNNESCRAVVVATAATEISIDAADSPYRDGYQDDLAMLQRLQESRALTIAAVNGMASGSGLALALGADICVAGPQGGFQFPDLRSESQEATGGIMKLLGLSFGPTRAAEFLLWRRVLTSSEAVKAGLARCAPPGPDFVEAVCAWASDLTVSARGDASHIRHALQLAAGRSIPQVL